MNTRPLTEEEISKILAAVNDKLASDAMDVSNVQGRVISIIKDGQVKKSGGIFVSHSEATNVSYKGIYYSLDEFLDAINNFLGSVKKEQTSTFTKKGKVEVDKKVVDTALHEFSSLYIKKKNTTNNNAEFYNISRSNENSDSIKSTGGLITKQNSNVKEGQYIDSAAAMKILSSIEVPVEEEKVVVPPIVKKEESKEKKKEETIIIPAPIPVRITLDTKKPNIDVPTKKEMEEAVESIGKKTPKESSFKVNKLHPSVKEKTKEYAKKLAPLLLIPILLIHQTKLIGRKYPGKGPLPPRINIEEIDDTIPIPDIPDDELPVKRMPEEKTNNNLKIGDIVMMEKGMKYDHNSQADDKISGTIGENPYREEGEYTVDVIAILDAETNAIIGYTGQVGGSLESLLEEHNLSMQDVESGKIRVRYNVSEGINKDLGRADAAGWVTYKSDTYEKKGNVQNMITLDTVAEGLEDQIKEGRSL